MKRMMIVLLVLFVAGCAGVGVKTQKSDYSLTGEEIQDILRHDKNLTPEQKIVLKHAAVELRNAQKQDIKNDQLQQQLVKESKQAGAGNLVYWIIGTVIFMGTVFVISKVLRVIPI